MLMLNMLGCIHKNLIYTIESTYFRRKFTFVINSKFSTILNDSFRMFFGLPYFFRFNIIWILFIDIIKIYHIL